MNDVYTKLTFSKKKKKFTLSIFFLSFCEKVNFVWTSFIFNDYTLIIIIIRYINGIIFLFYLNNYLFLNYNLHITFLFLIVHVKL